jgi:hypothetical protein
MTFVVTQKRQEEAIPQTNTEQPKKERLVATWVIENGELVCKWDIQ